MVCLLTKLDTFSSRFSKGRPDTSTRLFYCFNRFAALRYVTLQLLVALHDSDKTVFGETILRPTRSSAGAEEPYVHIVS